MLLYSNNKGKVHPRTGYEGQQGGVDIQLYSFSLTWALDGSGWSTPHPGLFTPPPHPRKTSYPLYRRLVGTQDRSGRVPTPGFDPRTVQPVAIRYIV